MTLSISERKIIVDLELEKAHKIYSQIEVLEKAEFWDNIANRLYYSLFHAVSALYEPRLLIKNMVNCILNYNQCAKGATIIAIMMFLKMIFCL